MFALFVMWLDVKKGGLLLLVYFVGNKAVGICKVWYLVRFGLKALNSYWLYKWNRIFSKTEAIPQIFSQGATLTLSKILFYLCLCLCLYFLYLVKWRSKMLSHWPTYCAIKCNAEHRVLLKSFRVSVFYVKIRLYIFCNLV